MASEMNEKRQILRHFLGALAYRTQKALRGSPDDFAAFDAGGGVRTPMELVRHMASVLGYARTFFIGGSYSPQPLDSFKDEIERLHENLVDLRNDLDSGRPMIDTTEERMLQGPFSDAMTHVGQLAMLRRLHGKPVPSENFILADVSAENVSSDQPDPVAPDE
jgi:hypothetical protein